MFRGNYIAKRHTHSKMQNKNGRTVFEELDSSIIQSITHFLNPQDISKLALTSRKIRMIFGKCVNLSLTLWQLTIFQKNIFLKSAPVISLLRYEALLQNYKAHLQNYHTLEAKKAYSSFVDQLDSVNISFYQNFFSTILDEKMQINPKYIRTKKVELINIHSQVIKKCEKLAQSSNIPTYKVQVINAQLPKLSKSAQKIYDFASGLTKSLVEIQNHQQPIIEINEIQRKYKETQRFLQKTKYLETIKYKNEYTNPIYYLNSSKNYHHFMNFNVNSVVFSFLTLYDLETLIQVDSKFSHYVENYLQVKLNQKYSELESLKKFPRTPELLEVDNLYRSCLSIDIRKWHLDELKCYNSPPPGVTETISTLFQVIHGSSEQNFRVLKLRLCKDNDILRNLYNSDIIELNESQFKILELFITRQEDIERYKKIVLISTKIITFLEFNYLIKKHQITKDLFYEFHSVLSQMSYQQNKIFELKRLQQKCLNNIAKWVNQLIPNHN